MIEYFVTDIILCSLSKHGFTWQGIQVIEVQLGENSPNNNNQSLL